MKNHYLPQRAKILKIRTESKRTNLYTLQLVEEKIQKNFFFTPGQFVFAGLLGHGEGPFDICSSSLERGLFEIAVRRVGSVTEKIHQLKVGDTLAVRGPYGHGFPMTTFADKNLLLLGGGCGFVTMRTVILDYIKQKPAKQKIQLFLGVGTPDDLLFRSEYPTWRKHLDLQLIVSEPTPDWPGQVGLITDLFDKVPLLDNIAVLACGPPVMYHFCLEKLKQHNIPDELMFFSFERRMDCGVGVCQHCAIGSKYVCKDGPVFSYADIKDVPGAI